MKMKNALLNIAFLALLVLSFGSCSLDDQAGGPIQVEPTTLELIQNSPDHTVLAQLLEDTGLNQALSQGTYTIFAPTNAAFENVDTSGLTQDELANILRNHVVDGAAESSDLETTYINTLAVETLSGNENNLSLLVNVGTNITLNGISTVTGPDNFASNGVVHVVDEVITIPDVTTFATADPNFDVLEEALTRDDQQEQNYVETLSSFDEPAPFTVFAPTNDAFSALLDELEEESLADIDAELLTSVLNTHVVAGANLTTNELEDGIVETLGDSFDLDAGNLSIVDLNGRTIAIVVTDVQAGNGVVHVVSTVILPEL